MPKEKTIIIEDLSSMPLWRWAAVISQLMRQYGQGARLAATENGELELTYTEQVPEEKE